MNVENRTLFIADNLDIMRGIDSKTVDLIYLDPPFNINRYYKAPTNSPAKDAIFKDIWQPEDIQPQWHGEIAKTHEALYQFIQTSEIIYGKSMKIYLIAMTVRIFEMHRILKPTGSIYLHCNPTASHYLKLIMDSIFGQHNCLNEIVWHHYTGSSNSKQRFARKHDIIHFYSSNNQTNFFDDIAAREPYAKDSNWVKNPESYGEPYYKANPHGKRMHDVWRIPSLNNRAKERTGYPTQKPLALLHRIIKASSNEGDFVLDPFCGCATACVAAEQLNRKWIGIDISPSAKDITKLRLEKDSEQGKLYSPIQMSDVNVASTPPLRTDTVQNSVQKPLPNASLYKNELYGKQEGYCNGCKLQFPIKNLTIDHIIPQSKGGTGHKDNLQLLCKACYSTKDNRTQEYLCQQLKEKGIL